MSEKKEDRRPLNENVLNEAEGGYSAREFLEDVVHTVEDVVGGVLRPPISIIQENAPELVEKLAREGMRAYKELTDD